jgi:tetratricopeptide (TPR) repeat protein
MAREYFIFCIIVLPLFSFSQETQSSDSGDNLFGLINNTNLNAANPNFFNERGLQKERNGSFEEALELYEKALNMAPNNLTFLYNVGITCQKLNQHEEAIIHLTKLTEQDKTDFEAFIALGNSLGEMKKYEEAIAAYNFAEMLRPSYKRIYYQRGIFKNLYGDLTSALKDFNIAVQREPMFANAYYNRGVNYKDMEKWKKAIRDLNRAIELDPNHGEAYMVRGVCYINSGNESEGAADLKRAADIGSVEGRMLYQKYIQK